MYYAERLLEIVRSLLEIIAGSASVGSLGLLLFLRGRARRAVRRIFMIAIVVLILVLIWKYVL